MPYGYAAPNASLSTSSRDRPAHDSSPKNRHAPFVSPNARSCAAAAARSSVEYPPVTAASAVSDCDAASRG
ncbi:MAG: hypothetical protein DMG01_02420 [Acidobacteria bacterium]|nr:MAG: hypothetical protein DMG01_02420 [Acidobacteriota bacterium]